MVGCTRGYTFQVGGFSKPMYVSILSNIAILTNAIDAKFKGRYFVLLRILVYSKLKDYIGFLKAGISPNCNIHSKKSTIAGFEGVFFDHNAVRTPY